MKYIGHKMTDKFVYVLLNRKVKEMSYLSCLVLQLGKTENVILCPSLVEYRLREIFRENQALSIYARLTSLNGSIKK